jgi:hypothetical protein
MNKNEAWKMGMKHPTPSIIRLFITQAIADTVEKECADNLALTFNTKASTIIDDAITKACQEFDKHGILAGLIEDKQDA